MKKILRFVSSITGKIGFNDVVFIIGLFVFSAILILGLFPVDDAGGNAGKSFFIYSMMAIPAIAAIYFIIISFRRRLSLQSPEKGASIKLKIALAFVFIAILPSLPIVLISNNIITHMISELLTEKTSIALEESLKMSREPITRAWDEMHADLASLNSGFSQGIYSVATPGGRDALSKIYRQKGRGIVYYYSGSPDTGYGIAPVVAQLNPYGAGIMRFLNVMRPRGQVNVYSISIGARSLILGTLYRNGIIVAMYTTIPEDVFTRISMFEDSLGTYSQREFLKPYFQTGVGIFLLIIAILIIMISIAVSMVLSNNITSPILELEEAARRVAAGDFNIQLRRDSSDEMGLLFDSFNVMAYELEESRKAMYHAQKLEAWREVARKLLHEIKNPLTPIRLSAERIQRRYRENNPNIGEIIINGTDTIIEEVNMLMGLLGEFSRFARLPEIKPETEKLNPIIESCVNFFHGHEKVSFHAELDPSLPEVYCDRILMRQAFTNLLQNSIDAVERKGTIYITSGLVVDKGVKRVRVTIRDDGQGIKPEDIDKIFDPTFSTKEHGTGIGLAIVEKIILEHHGSIRVRSKPGEGTEFSIELPVAERGT